MTGAVFDAMMADISEVMKAEQPDVGKLVEALLLTSVDAGELSIPEVGVTASKSP